MDAGSRLAFVDVETTGLGPRTDRIAEIGVVTVDGDRVERWGTLLRGGSEARTGLAEWKSLPAFADIAQELAQRLSGRLFIAHNARFDYAFVCAEFERAGLVFEAPVVCTVMLSRKLRPHLARHDLDSVAADRGLRVEERHRALPDADLLHRWWADLRGQFDDATIGAAVETLLTGPVLPAELDPALVESLPSAPGAYLMRARDGRLLAIGAARNLRGHVIDYFRVDRATSRALEWAHLVADIACRRTRGLIGARLHAAALMRAHWPDRVPPDVTWRLSPEAVPCLDVMPIDACRAPHHRESFGLFASDRKALNALHRLASRHALCHAMLGLDGECAACETAGCGTALARKRHLLRAFAAVRPYRIEAWPYAGAIGIRERGEIHVVDGWQFLGTARDDGEARELSQTRRAGFDRRMYKVLRSELARLAPGRIVDLGGGHGASPPARRADAVDSGACPTLASCANDTQ
ncbi:MAG: exonuclease domain-containing protein [Burkholderiales bacterium]